MQLSYSVKLEANAGKVKRLDDVLFYYQRLVQNKIAEYWPFQKLDFKSAYPPKESRTGSRFIALAARRAWSMVKGAKTRNGPMPVFRGMSVHFETNDFRVNFSGSGTSFDGWLFIPTLTKRARIALPFRKYALFRQIEAVGTVAKSVRLVRRKRGWFAIFTFKMAEKESASKKRIGIDVGYSVAAATSTGAMYGAELESLQRQTKWRSYRSNNSKPYRQGLNRVAKEIIAANPQTDFAVEQLNFKGKRKRSKLFRTRLSRFAYQHLAERLEQHGKQEGFSVTRVDPAYTSQTCPECGTVDSSSRSGQRFHCVKCGHTAHADVNGAVNINGGEAVVHYAGAETSSPRDYATQEYQGTFNAPTAKHKSQLHKEL